jgi:DUF1680 family protein
MTADSLRPGHRLTILRALAAALSCTAVVTAQLPPPISDYPIRPVPIQDVRVTGGFWAAKIETNRRVTIPLVLERSERKDRNNADPYRAIEAASFSLLSHPDRALLKRTDDLAALVAGARRTDGDLRMDDAGPLLEAAVVHYQATGARTLLDFARRVADGMVTTSGPAAARGVPGHDGVNLSLVKLYRTTGDRRYLDLAKSLLDERKPESTPPGGGIEALASRIHVYSAMTDVAAMLRDPASDLSVDKSWRDLVSTRIYVTGAISSDDALSNRGTADTCAAAAWLLWNHRMFMKSGETKHLDLLEHALYNGALPGVSIKGDSFFTQIPLESRGEAERSRNVDGACRPADLARLVAQVPGFIYATRPGPAGAEIFVNQYVDSDAVVRLDAATVRITQATAYPWDGRVSFRVAADRPVTFTLKLRVPGWLGDGPFDTDLYTFSGPEPGPTSYGAGNTRVSTTRPGWVELRLPLAASDTERVAAITADISLPMPARRLVAHARVPDAAGRSALQRGPLLYAFEASDNGGRVLDLTVPADQAFTPTPRPKLLGGVTVLSGAGTRAGPAGVTSAAPIVAVPYFAWGNRGRGEMIVWVPR